jgi:hypothetical protein
LDSLLSFGDFDENVLIYGFFEVLLAVLDIDRRDQVS